MLGNAIFPRLLQERAGELTQDGPEWCYPHRTRFSNGQIMKIADVQIFRVEGQWPGGMFLAGDRQARPMDVYPEFNTDHSGTDGARTIRALYVQIDTDDGVSGVFGPIQKHQAFIIYTMLRSFLRRGTLCWPPNFPSDLIQS